ncbi:MAG: hypothetical protein H6737_00270 [Alphaproteobacteria bacterium]|nr:hypothetical protein [Alphaproteobacteria bacterium]
MILLALAAWGQDAEVSLHGDLKTFFTATFPYEHVFMPENPTGQGVFDNRMKLAAKWRALSFEAHHTTTAITSQSASAGFGTSTGVGLQAPELVDLSWVAFDEDLVWRGRIDRFNVSWRPDGIGITVGRQPITFGNAQMFTPLDLVNPFTPAVIDQEYKPGVDAIRADVYHGFATKVTLAAAYAGSWDPSGLIVASYGQTTVGVTDIGLFLGSVRGDAVVGTSVVTSVGPIGLSSDVSLTAPQGREDDPYLRGTLGVLWRPGANTTVSAEAYVQTVGATNPDRYLGVTGNPRFARGELWLMGVAYLGVAVSQQIRPTLTGSLAAIGNVLDPSAFVAPSLAWSVANNADFVVGGFMGVGARPDDVALTDLIGPDGPKPLDELTYLNSEFGTYPAVAFVQARLYF